jgi:hypothetical protein
VDLAGVRLGCLVADGEAEPHPAPVPASLGERCEQLFDLSRGETTAFVLDVEEDALGSDVGR